MNKKIIKALSLCLSAVFIALCFTSCSLTEKKQAPEAVTVKTDLHDAVFTFTYGELSDVLSPDQVAALFEDYDSFNKDTTIDLSYNDIKSRFDSDDKDNHDFENVMALLSDEETAQLTANSEEVLKYFVENINKVKAEKPITEYAESFWTDKDFKFSQDGAESDSRIKQAAKYFEYFVTNGVNGKLSEGNNEKGYKLTKKGDSLDDIVYLYGSDKACLLTMDDVESVISSLSYEKEPYEEEYTDENGRTKKRTVDVVTGITRIISITLKDDRASVIKAFSERDKSVVLDEMKKAEGYFEVDDYSVEYNGCTITVTFNAATDNILTAVYDKNMTVSTEITGAGSLEYLGKQQLEFGCTDRVDYKFGWAEEAK